MENESIGVQLDSIRAERDAEMRRGGGGFEQLLEAGSFEEAADNLVFFAPAEGWNERLDLALDCAAEAVRSEEGGKAAEALRFLVRLRLDLDSQLPEWGLRDRIGREAIGSAVERAARRIAELDSSSAAGSLLGEMRATERLRLAAEGLEDAAAGRDTEALTAGSLSETCTRLADDGREDNLAAIARGFREGASETMLGNDFADHLDYPLRRGFCFQTTNPPLVQMAWDSRREFWRGELEKRFAYEGAADPRERVMEMTMAVVGRGCRRLRPLFLLSEGSLGYVCYQVNPHNHGDSAAMIREVREVYRRFRDRLGGVPNVSFKLPGTAAGLAAARDLTAAGISVTITLSFAAFQIFEFARVLQRGCALFNAVVVMNGRLAFPVRDELREAGVAGGEEAARYAGVEVTRRVYRLLYTPAAKGGLGIDPRRVRIMNASLRIYGVEIPDLDGIWGTPAITVFPNLRRAYDATERPFDAVSVGGATPERYLEILAQSELFRQACWLAGDGPELRPEAPLSLDPGAAGRVAAWPPIRETLEQFLDAYDRTLATAAELFA